MNKKEDEKIVSLISSDKKSIVKIVAGELISYIKDGEEFIHQKGDPGWRNSDTEMFPIVGPTQLNNFRVKTKRGECIQDQHGLFRELPYDVIQTSESCISFQKKYNKNTSIQNSKYPQKSSEKEVSWPYDFEIQKELRLDNDCLKIIFHIETEKEMPFMFGYHPAFKLSGTLTEVFKLDNNKEVSINDVIRKGSNALPLLNKKNITLVRDDNFEVNIKTEGFGNLMLWAEVQNMVCIEPITHYPLFETQKYSEENMRISKGKEVFSVEIRPSII